MYLVDTDVISAGTRLRADNALTVWMDRNSDRLYLSAISIAEIEDGIAQLRRKGAAGKGAHLASWLEGLLHLYGDRVLAFDVTIARITGRLSDQARSQGRSPGFPDLAIAATATAHGLTVLTRNVRHFRPLGAPVHDPFASLPTD